ncbi:MAG: SMP-30/gluconolactonase/LRE family protein [Betaproteobacteria bacterium]|nr:SMP-30/gluconolactonase/LRE family protein [Betaproteobacteria bacterium]NBT74616.1 SMP-30/gluconolactonase/LRE family protein [Betaproteobacteria bacterium]NBY13918.1 SMP-30/gluconolactonase/LRE family protein [Betaproteobacteria bacterium]NCA15913.1 SMP-30/gluconolactonase/LRE family protein [Betaproteobacteria bacterium]
MFNPFAPLEKIKAEVYSSMPAKFRKKTRSAWSDPNRQGAEVECFLEGPSFDRDGNLWFVDIPFGRIFRLSTKGDWDLVTQYDGWPNGLKFDRQGMAWICCYKKGLLRLDPKTGVIETILETAFSEGFKGLNDLHFATNGDLYFTDQGQTGIADPTGRVYRLRANGALDRLVTNIPSPNGITLSTSEKHCYVGVTRSQQVWRLPLMADGSISKTGVAIQLSGGVAGPDGIEMDSENGLLVCHLGVGIWRFDSNMLPTHLIYSEDPHHHHLANLCFGGPDRKQLFITESLSGDILTARVPVAGKLLVGLS